MKISKTTFVATIVTCSMLFTAVGVGASNGIQKIQAALNHNITFKLDGSDWVPKTSEGDKLSALIYDGTTYVPLRAVSEGLGADVAWNSSSQRITINSSSNVVSPNNSVEITTPTPSITTETPSSKGLMYLSGTTAEMTKKMKEQAATIIKLYGEALSSGSTAKYDTYVDTYISDKRENSPIYTTRVDQKKRFKEAVSDAIKSNDSSTIQKYANVLKNVSANDIETSFISDKNEYSQSFQYKFYPKDWSAYDGVYTYFTFSAIEYDSSSFVLSEAYIN